MTPTDKSKLKKIVATWVALLVVIQTAVCADDNDHGTVSFWLIVTAVVLFSAQRLVRFGDAAAAGRCPMCRGRVKAKATACGKCGRVVRGPAVGA